MNPRRLEYFERSLEALDYVDVFLAQNMEIVRAQNTIRKAFLEGDYDYLLFTSDDVIIPYLAPYRIMKDCEIFRHDIITGWSPLYAFAPDTNISGKAPPNIEDRIDKPFYREDYKLFTVRQIQNLVYTGEELYPVWFVGWSITAISRRVVEAWTPRGWYFQVDKRFQPSANSKGEGGFYASSDLWFSYQTWKLGLEKYADLTVCVPHLPPKNKKDLLVGLENPQTLFIPKRRDLP
jgi:hypothetical protein